MSDSAWRTVSLPSALLEEIQSFVEKRPDYRSSSEFIREAIRSRLRALIREPLTAEVTR